MARRLAASAAVGAVLAVVVAGCSSQPVVDDAPAAATETEAAAEPEAPPEPEAVEDEPAPEPAVDAPADDGAWRAAAETVAERARPAVVAVLKADHDWPAATGFLVADDLVVTERDVVVFDGQTLPLMVRTFDGRNIAAQPIWTADGQGAALLQLAEPAEGIEPLELGSARELAFQQTLVTIGHPQLGEQTGGWQVFAGSFHQRQDIVAWAHLPGQFGNDNGYRDGMVGSPILDLDGNVVALMCCEKVFSQQPTVSTFAPGELEIYTTVPFVDGKLRGGWTADLVRSQLEGLLP